MREDSGNYVPDRVDEHITVDPYGIEIKRDIIGVTCKTAKVFYQGEQAGIIEQKEDGKWYIPPPYGNPKRGWEKPMYPADLVVRRWLRIHYQIQKQAGSKGETST